MLSNDFTSCTGCVVQVVRAAPVQAAALLGQLPHHGHAHRLLHLRLLPRVPHLRAAQVAAPQHHQHHPRVFMFPQTVQSVGLPRDAGPGAPLPRLQVCGKIFRTPVRECFCVDFINTR